MLKPFWPLQKNVSFELFHPLECSDYLMQSQACVASLPACCLKDREAQTAINLIAMNPRAGEENVSEASSVYGPNGVDLSFFPCFAC